MALKNALAFIAVRDIEASTRWYKMLLGREPDTQPMKGLVELQIDTVVVGTVGHKALGDMNN